MDLEYQSHGNVDIVKQLNRLDKLTSKLNLTLRDVPESQQITKNQKEQIIKYITKDRVSMLSKYTEKEVIAPTREVGAKGSRWNLLHLCAKHDAVECAKLILKKIYQQDTDEYLEIINLQTAEGYTPLMISIIYQANKVLQLFLRLGGSDLGIMQSSKQRAYDLALNYQNQMAIQELIVYQDRCKKQMYINKQELMQEVVVIEDEGWLKSCMGCLFDYLLCLNREEVENQPAESPLMRKFSNLLKGDERLYAVDAVKIGSRRDIEDYEIEWKKLSSIQGQKCALFDSFKPLDISQNQFSLRHNLILFQALSDYSWIVKRAISKMEDSNKNKQKNEKEIQKFIINLYKNFTAVKMEVDQCVPYVKERGQMMFLSNPNEIWPMMLQKGLAKLYSSYIQLNNIIPCETLEDITAFYSHSLPISAFSNESIVSNLQDLSLKGYMILLEGREKTELNSSKETELYSILNYYQKGSTKKMLVNCPNVVNNWKQSKENRQLAMIKAHFNKHNQSCLWIDESKIDYYFKAVTICYLRENYLRSQLKMRMKIKKEEDLLNKDVVEDSSNVVRNYKKAIFFRFKVERKIDDPIVLQLIDLQTKYRFDLSSLAGWKNEGRDVLAHQSQSQNCKQLTKITPQPGEYTCMFELSEQQITNKQQYHLDLNKNIIRVKREGQEEIKITVSQIKQEKNEETKKKVKINLSPEHRKELILLAWWVEPLQIQYLEQEFGSIQWLSHFKNYSISNWLHLMKEKRQEDCFLYQTVNQKTILIIKTKSVKKAYLQLLDFETSQWKKSNSIIEGKLIESQSESSIQLVREPKNQNFFYTVFSNITVQEFQKQKKIRFLYEYE